MALLLNKVTASSADGATAVSNPASLRASSTTIWIAKSSSTMRTIGKLFPTFSRLHKVPCANAEAKRSFRINAQSEHFYFREFHRAAGGRGAKNKAASAVGQKRRSLGVR